MTLDDLLHLFLIAADDSGRVFRHSDLAEWPEGGLELFTQLGILRRGSGGLLVECMNCTEPHLERVTTLESADGSTRMFIPCPESLRVEVTAEMTECWEVNPAGLARSIAVSLDLFDTPSTLLKNRLWKLGRLPWKKRSRELLFACRLRDVDASETLCKVPRGGCSVVLVPHEIPDDRVWPGRVPAVLSLSSVLVIENKKIVVDGGAFMESILDADAVIVDLGQVPPDQKSRANMRKDLKSVLEDMCTGEQLVQAYRDFGSITKAVDGLKLQGVKTNRSAIHRAIKKAGGLAAVMGEEDSASVSRTVSSQPRNRGEKYDQRTK